VHFELKIAPIVIVVKTVDGDYCIIYELVRLSEAFVNVVAMNGGVSPTEFLFPFISRSVKL